MVIFALTPMGELSTLQGQVGADEAATGTLALTPTTTVSAATSSVMAETVTLTPTLDATLPGITVDNSRAQMLARVGHPTGAVQPESDVSASVAQMNTRRQQKTR